jgi:hypothetical protein
METEDVPSLSRDDWLLHHNALASWRNSREYDIMFKFFTSKGEQDSNDALGLWRRANEINWCRDKFWIHVASALKACLPERSFKDILDQNEA